MDTLPNKLIALTAVGILAVIGSLMNSRHLIAQTTASPTAAQGSAPVTIVSPIPLPVSGTTTVSGTVAATQSGQWTVGIAGTPSVNITGTPTVSIHGDSLPRIKKGADIDIPAGKSFADQLIAGVTTPVVIDFVSARCDIPAGQAIQVLAQISFEGGGSSVELTSLSPVAPAGAQPKTAIAQQTSVAADSIAAIEVLRTDTTGSASCSIDLWAHPRT